MDSNTVLTLIGSIGFPAAMCLLMYFDNKEVRKDHKEEVKSLSSAIENNTIAMTKLVEKVDRMEDEL